MQTLSPSSPADALRRRYEQLQSTQPHLRVREAARSLGVSEAELVAAQGAVPLAPDWPALLGRLPALGEVMVLCRNEACVHERHGRYEKVELQGMVGLVLGPDIDLRLFLQHWRHAYACSQMLPSGLRHSLQVFDAHGEAIHKLYLTEHSDHEAWNALVQDCGRPVAALPRIDPARPPRALRADTAIDVPGLRAAWSALRDTHDFAGLLRRFDVGRQQALRLAGAPLARAVASDAPARLLEACAARAEPLMVFVGNRGCIQIHSGPVERVARKGPWLNVLDARFNLHLREDLVRDCWIVRKPTEDGVVTSLELFDEGGELIAQFFGLRKPGQPERGGWRERIGALEALA